MTLQSRITTHISPPVTIQHIHKMHQPLTEQRDGKLFKQIEEESSLLDALKEKWIKT